MNWQKMTVVVLAAGALTLGGCDEKTLKENAAKAQEKASQAVEAGKEQAGEIAAQAQAAFDDLKKEWAPQIDQLSSKVDTLKAEAAKFKDQQLDGYISQLSTKVTEIKAKLGEMVSGDGLTTLKDNLGKWMGEAKKLYDDAAARLAELTKGAAGG